MKNLFDAREIYLAAVLMTKGFTIKKVEFEINENQPFAVGCWWFERTEELNKTVQNYWQNKLLIEPRQFITNLRGLKAQSVNFYRSPNKSDTRDIYLASTLVSLKHKILQMDFQHEGNNPRPVGYWRFEDSPEVKKIIEDYWRNQTVVEPRTYIANLRSLKAQTILKK